MENGPGSTRARKVYMLPLIISFVLAVVAIIPTIVLRIPLTRTAAPVPTAVEYTPQPTLTPMLPSFTSIPTRTPAPTPTMWPTTAPGLPQTPPSPRDACLLPCAAPWAATATAETKATATTEAKEIAATATAEMWRAMQTQQAADSKARATATAENREFAVTATAEARIAASITREAQESAREQALADEPRRFSLIAFLGSAITFVMGISPTVTDWWQDIRSSKKKKLEVEMLSLQVQKLELEVRQLKKELGHDASREPGADPQSGRSGGKVP